MSRIKGTKSSAALIVAIVALVAALGGGAVAGVAVTSLSKKDKKQVKKISKQQGKKQANKQISKKAPKLSVASANSAERFGGMTAERIAPVTLNNGGSQVLGTFGPFTLTATCSINLSNFDTALVRITTGKNNSAFKGEDSDPDFDVGDTPNYVDATATPTGTPAFEEDGGAAVAPGGAQLLGHQLYAGVNVLGQTGTCRFGGVIFVG